MARPMLVAGLFIPFVAVLLGIFANFEQSSTIISVFSDKLYSVKEAIYSKWTPLVIEKKGLGYDLFNI